MSEQRTDSLPVPQPIPATPTFKNLADRRFGELTVLYYVGRRGGNAAWFCHCDCGVEKVVSSGRLTCTRRPARSCGCRVPGKSQHPTLRQRHKPEYMAWVAMRGRCSNRHDKYYAGYGGRGISVCERWQRSFKAFMDDMGPKPTPQHSIDRRNNDSNYEPGNCRWATRKEQQQNTRTTHLLTFQGRTMCVVEWARELGISATTLYARLSRGDTPQQALSRRLGERLR